MVLGIPFCTVTQPQARDPVLVNEMRQKVCWLVPEMDSVPSGSCLSLSTGKVTQGTVGNSVPGSLIHRRRGGGRSNLLEAECELCPGETTEGLWGRGVMGSF